MRIQRQTSIYNERRYGQPWIARIVLADGKLDYQWGQWIGNHSHGSEGLLVLDNIQPDEFYARGQKDFRKPANSAPTFYRLQKDGKGIVVNKVDVYRELSQPVEVQNVQ